MRLTIRTKDLEFGLANNGIVGFEVTLALGYTFGRTGFNIATLAGDDDDQSGKLLQQFRYSVPGRPADLVLVNLENPFIFDRDAMLSKARNAPFTGGSYTDRYN